MSAGGSRKTRTLRAPQAGCPARSRATRSRLLLRQLGLAASGQRLRCGRNRAERTRELAMTRQCTRTQKALRRRHGSVLRGAAAGGAPFFSLLLFGGMVAAVLNG
jgi:hypothetical protein